MTRAAEKTSKSYHPPYFLSNSDPNASADTYIEMILREEAANHADIMPRSKRLDEIRSKKRMIQSISSITYKTDGTTTYASDFDRWSAITPGSTGDALHQVLCQ